MERLEITTEKGQTMAEYAVILGVITATVVTSFTVLSGAIEAALLRVLEVVGGIG